MQPGTTIHRRSASTTYTAVDTVCEVQLANMKLITSLILICFVMETVHCSRSWNSWDYLKKATLDRSSIDTDDDHGPVMPLQVRIMMALATSYRRIIWAAIAESAGSVTGV